MTLRRIPFLFLFLFSLAGAQQKPYDVSGRIIEAGSGEPLIGANVLIYKDSTRTDAPLRGAATNKFGYYSFLNLQSGTYYFFISSLGYETLMKVISLTGANHSPKHNFELRKQDVQLDEVVVEDKKRLDFTTTTSTIDVSPEMVKTLPSLGGETDIFRALQLLPGVKTASEIATGIYVRGGSADQNLTLVDGVTVYNPSHLGGFASTFNGDAVQDIKLMKGAFPAEYGGRLSSVLDVTMREGNREKFVGTAGLNLISGRVTIEGPLSDSSTYIFSARRMFLDKLLSAFPDADNIPRYNFYDFNGKVNYYISDIDRIFVSGFFSADRLSNPPANTDIDFGIDWSNATTNLTWTRFNSASVFTNTSLMLTNYEFSTLIKDKFPTAISLDFYTGSEITDLRLLRDMQIILGENHTIKTGAEIIYHDFSTTTSDYFIDELLYKDGYGKSIKSFEASIYAQDEIKIGDFLSANGGLRMYYFQNGQFLQFEPRASVTWFFLDRFTLRSSFSIAHQNLHLLARNDIFLPTDVWYPSTAKIRPSKAVQGSLGFEAISYNKSYLFSIEGYYKKMTNLHEYRDNATFAYESDFEDQITTGYGEAYGVEFFINKRLGAFTGWIGYTLAYTKRFFDRLNRGLPFYPRFDRRHDISVVTSYTFNENLSFGATWTYSTGQAYSLPVGQYSMLSLTRVNPTKPDILFEYSNRDGYRLPPFHKLDISARYIYRMEESDLEFSLSIYNAYNRYNAFSKYIGYKLSSDGKTKIPVLKQFTLFPFLPTLGVNFTF
ncbi:MAG: TonB-dependent receptor [Ignavibacteriaceae bacterium]|nr:TonB-dependent receptor [Ignavibacteriaceae bacterium]